MSGDECSELNLPYPILPTTANKASKFRECDEKVATLDPLPLCPRHPKWCSCMELFAMQNTAVRQIRHYYTQIAYKAGGDMVDLYLLSMLVPKQPRRRKLGAKETVTWQYKVPNVLPWLTGEPLRCAI